MEHIVSKLGLFFALVASMCALFVFGCFAKENLSDEAFFGKWENGHYTTVGKLNYDYNGGVLHPVEECVKAGDYEGAKAALLKYYQERTERKVLPLEDTDIEVAYDDPKVAAWHCENIFSTEHDKEEGRMTFTNQKQTVTIDATEGFNQANGTSKQLGFYLIGAQKTEDIVTISSKEGDSAPTLTLKDASGKEISLIPIKDSYIKGNFAQNFGGATALNIRSHGYPYDVKEFRAYMVFDLNQIPAGFIPVSATLSVTGQNNPDSVHPGTEGKTEVIVVRTGDNAWLEATLNWMNIKGSVYSWNGGTFNWTTPSNAEGEWLIWISRFQFAFKMATEYQKDPTETYYSGNLLRIIREFTEQNAFYFPSPSTNQGSRSIDVGIRCFSLVSAYDMIRNSPAMTKEDNVELIKLLWQEGNYLSNRSTLKGNNWDVLQMKGLYYIVSYFPEFTDASKWDTFAQETMETRVRSVNFDDFSCFEGCIWYDNVIAGGCNTMVGMARLNGDNVSPALLEYLSRMGEHIMNGCYPNGYEIGWGDGAYVDKTRNIKIIADNTNDPYLTYFATRGTGGGEAPPYLSTYYHGVRAGIMRTSWKDDAVYMFMQNYSSGHSHPSLLAPMLYAYDKPLIVDNGRRDYSADAITSWIRGSTEAHNTIEINDGNQKKATGEKLYWLTNSGTDFYEGAHIAYEGFEVQRSVLFVKPDYFIVSDYVLPKDLTKQNRYDQHWHYYPGANLAIDPDTKKSQTAYSQGANIQVVPADADELTAITKDGYFSSETGVTINTKFTEYTKNVSGEVTFDTVLYPTKEGDSRSVAVSRMDITPDPGKLGTALSIDTGDGTDVYYMSHKREDYKKASFGQYSFDGKLAYVGQNSIQVVDGKQLTKGDTPLVKSANGIKSLYLQFDGDTLTVDGEKLLPTTDPKAAIAIYAPGVETVLFDGATIPVVKDGDYLYAVGAKPADRACVFEESFDELLNNWTNKDHAFVSNCRLAVFDNEKVLSNLGDDWKDYQFAAEVEIQKGSAYFHFNTSKDGKNGYVLQLDSSSDKAVLSKLVNGSSQQLAEKPVSIDTDTVYAVSCKSDSGVLTVTIDGTELLTANDAAYTGGRVALGASSDGYVFFDNASVTLKEAPPEPEPLSTLTFGFVPGFYNGNNEKLEHLEAGTIKVKLEEASLPQNPSNVIAGLYKNGALVDTKVISEEEISKRYIFREGFENGLDAWSLVPDLNTNFKMTLTHDHAHNGNYAFQVPVECDRQGVEHFLDDTYHAMADVWFYDDAEDTTVSEIVYLTDANKKFILLGAYSGRDPNFYSGRSGGTWFTTSVPRTTGWHKFTFDFTKPNEVTAYIDGVQVQTISGVNGIKGISLRDNWATNPPSTSVCSYDDIAVYDPTVPLPEVTFTIPEGDNPADYSIRLFGWQEDSIIPSSNVIEWK